MNERQIEIIKSVVNRYADLAHLNNQNMRDDIIAKLSSMNEQDAIDFIVVSLSDLVSEGRAKVEDVLNNIGNLTELSEKYPTKESLMERLKWLNSMNLDHPDMPLQENHELVLEVFDKFNYLIGTNFDAYYTGGLMGYIATNHPLERYHGDLDVFINEEELPRLFELINQSEDFEVYTNMDHKEANGHEFAVRYKGTPMTVGLFLFERKPDNEMIIKEYYHKDYNPNNEVLYNAQHLDPEYAKLCFSDTIREHNGIPFRMQSLESIYNSKKSSRPKDRYDANLIKDSIDLNKEAEIDKRRNKIKNEVGLDGNNTIVTKLEQQLNNPNVGMHL